MAVYNAGPYLELAVESVLNQTFRDLEFVAVDDGSTDGSGAKLDEFAARDQRIKILHQANLGVPAAVNHGLRYCRGEYIARMDADDVCYPDRLEKQIAYLDRHTNVAAVGGSIQPIDSRGQCRGPIGRYPCDPERVAARLRAGDCCLAQPAVTLRRSCLEAVGGYRWALKPAEDYDLWLRLLESYDLANVHDLVLQYRFHSGSISTRQPHIQELARRAALAAANLRRDGQRDPIGDARELTPDLLARLGISAAEAELISAEAYRRRASNLLHQGEVDAAEATLTALGRQGFSASSIRRVAPEVEFVRARIQAARGRRLLAAAAVVRTLVRYPSFSIVLLGKGLRHVVRRIGYGTAT